MQFEFHIIFTFHDVFFFSKYYSSDFFPQPLKNVKTILSSWAIQTQVGGWIWPMGHYLRTPTRASFLSPCVLYSVLNRAGQQSL